MRVIGYARLSRATEESTSIARQRQAIEDTARVRGWELVGTEEDNDVSATRARLDRPGLNAVRAAIAAHDADAVLVWKLDRLARSVVDFGTLLDEGLQIISCTEPLDTTSSMGRAMAEILQVFAAMEARNIGMRVSSARRHLPTIGRFPGGPAPYGYQSAPHPDGVGRTLIPDPAQAAVVRRAVDAVLGGQGPYAVCRDLNDDGIPTQRGSQWQTATLMRMLRSDALLGRAKSNGRIVRNAAGLPVTVYTPLIKLDEHERLVELLSPTETPDRAARAARGRLRASRVLSGLIYCHSCSRPLTARHGARSDYASMYVCQTRNRGQLCEQPVSGNAERVEAVVEAQFLALFGAAEVFEEVVTSAGGGDVSLIEAAIRETTDELREPDADIAQLVDRLTSLRAQREQVEATPRTTSVERVPTGETYAERWNRSDYLGRRAALLAAGVYAVLHPAAARGRWDETRVSVEMDAVEEYTAADEV